ncbi:LON peptidase substrate-binding domain-containing protein [Marinobacter sp. M1N3S26]|uniref:LON peptidase substrate-binding domain-containing protein n=1 Tax=Marinobacter sp. M1N3S26 TaxID=3382299 RepID=UPI00387B2C13
MTQLLDHVPLFPLSTTVLPGGRLPLQLFEPRYLDMLATCLREQRGFVVLLLREGNEAGADAVFYDIGTYVQIVDFQQLDNGLLGITVEGLWKVAVHRSWQAPDGLNVGHAERLPDEPEDALPAGRSELASVLRALLRHPVVNRLELEVDFSSAREVGWRLIELLPLNGQEKQRLLEYQDPLARLDRLSDLLEAME